MATLTTNQILLEKYKNHPEVLPGEVKDTVEAVNEYNRFFPEEYNKTAAEVLQMAEIMNTRNASMYLRQTISEKYKEVSQRVNPATLKPVRKKKTMKELMQQSVFHGANWLGSNFIA